ncbi:hypothetical protein AB4254_11585 [Vibrio breoganii]
MSTNEFTPRRLLLIQEAAQQAQQASNKIKELGLDTKTKASIINDLDMNELVKFAQDHNPQLVVPIDIENWVKNTAEAIINARVAEGDIGGLDFKSTITKDLKYKLQSKSKLTAYDAMVNYVSSKGGIVPIGNNEYLSSYNVYSDKLCRSEERISIYSAKSTQERDNRMQEAARKTLLSMSDLGVTIDETLTASIFSSESPKNYPWLSAPHGERFVVKDKFGRTSLVALKQVKDSSAFDDSKNPFLPVDENTKAQLAVVKSYVEEMNDVTIDNVFFVPYLEESTSKGVSINVSSVKDAQISTELQQHVLSVNNQFYKQHLLTMTPPETDYTRNTVVIKQDEELDKITTAMISFGAIANAATKEKENYAAKLKDAVHARGATIEVGGSVNCGMINITCSAGKPKVSEATYIAEIVRLGGNPDELDKVQGKDIVRNNVPRSKKHANFERIKGIQTDAKDLMLDGHTEVMDLHSGYVEEAVNYDVTSPTRIRKDEENAKEQKQKENEIDFF